MAADPASENLLVAVVNLAHVQKIAEALGQRAETIPMLQFRRSKDLNAIRPTNLVAGCAASKYPDLPIMEQIISAS